MPPFLGFVWIWRGGPRAALKGVYIDFVAGAKSWVLYRGAVDIALRNGPLQRRSPSTGSGE